MNNNDNQHGMCCGCPSKHDGSRMLTIWESSKQYHTKLARYTNTFNDSNSFRKTLAENPQLVDTFNDQYLKPTSCQDSATTGYRKDTNNYHDVFYNEILKQMGVPQQVSGDIEKVFAIP